MEMGSLHACVQDVSGACLCGLVSVAELCFESVLPTFLKRKLNLSLQACLGGAQVVGGALTLGECLLPECESSLSGLISHCQRTLFQNVCVFLMGSLALPPSASSRSGTRLSLPEEQVYHTLGWLHHHNKPLLFTSHPLGGAPL